MKYYILFLIFILIIGTFTRFYQLDVLPNGLHPDEAANGLDIIRMIDNHDFRVFYNTNGPREALFFYLQGIFVALGIFFNIPGLGFTSLALRIAPALIGISTIFGIYLLVKQWFGKNYGLLASLFMAISTWHIQFSRNGFRAIMVPFILVFLFYFLTKAIREKKLKYFILSAIFFSLGFYTYLSYLMVLPMGFFFILFLLFLKRDELKIFLKNNWKKILIACFVAFIIYIPLLFHYFKNPGDFLQRSNSISVFNPEFGNPFQLLIKNIIEALLMFIIKGDANYRHNFGSLPMIDPFLGIFFIIGAFIILSKLNKSLYFFLFLWFGFMLAPTILSAESTPHALRSVGTIPIAYIFSVIGIKFFYEFFTKKNIYLTTIIIISIILRFLFISQRSIWHDEGYTALMIKFPLWEIIQRTMFDVHPPFYYLLLHCWAQIFGNSEIALRGFSASLGVGVVILTYLFIKKLFNKNIATVAAFFTSVGPFLIRYSQEARMWELVALLIIGSSFFLIKALEQLENKQTKKRKIWWVLYSVSIILAAYTQYFSLLILPVHWLYVLLRKKIFSFEWWLSNISIIVAFSFWIPVLLTQTSRISSGYWIQKSWITIRTVSSTFYRFLSYTNLDYINFGKLGRFYVPNYIHSMILILLIIIVIIVFLKNKKKWKEIIFILGYFLIPTYIVFFYSLIATPIYQDRYFVWCAVGFHSFLALFICSLKRKLQLFFISLIIILSIFGIFGVYITETHGMREAGQFIQNNFQKNDEIIAGELYVYFDFIYYNKTGQITKLLANPEDIKKGFGEASLIYDKTDLIVRKNFNELRPINNRVWIVGKPWGDYYKKIPNNWQELKHFEKKDSAVKLYSIN